VAERCPCAYSTQIGGRCRSGKHSGDAVGGSQADECSGRLAQGAGEDGFCGSESDIELVAVSCKFDFSERRNLLNMEMDPDRKLPNGFWGLSFSLSPVILSFLFSPSLSETDKELLPFSRRLFSQPLLLRPSSPPSSPLIISLLSLVYLLS